ncbi:hypothetical protein COB55_00920 [Candidatus Wolfebacteria bacterium]|nr:MAG: hypothetical protein COB55_00920 [Candidatus Wolfebacteria bacterium]
MKLVLSDNTATSILPGDVANFEPEHKLLSFFRLSNSSGSSRLLMIKLTGPDDKILVSASSGNQIRTILELMTLASPTPLTVDIEERSTDTDYWFKFVTSE